MQTKKWVALGTAIAISGISYDFCEGSDFLLLPSQSDTESQGSISAKLREIKSITKDTFRKLKDNEEVLTQKLKFSPETLNFFSETLLILEQFCKDHSIDGEIKKEEDLALEEILDELTSFNNQLEKKGIRVPKTEADKKQLKKEIEISFRLYAKWMDDIWDSSEDM